MPGPLHRVARWLRLVLAFLTVAGASAPAHALPTAGSIVAVWVERHEPSRPRPAVEAPVSRVRADTAPTRVHVRAALPGIRHEVRTAGPPRRLFLMHRALLH
ncbi:hypothetical protein JQX13_01460 [Archangium violaceum]|uniref:hypothetical protein n=1 Tax=Archangium violaceum TaxID=83451 RepID=UPI00193C7F6F|nr:hypothetical protein [Archangium violaceum]QRK08868.1 hypothetical protein JQX13_01460 [Archangium violaceum]